MSASRSATPATSVLAQHRLSALSRVLDSEPPVDAALDLFEAWALDISAPLVSYRQVLGAIVDVETDHRVDGAIRKLAEMAPHSWLAWAGDAWPALADAIEKVAADREAEKRRLEEEAEKRRREEADQRRLREEADRKYCNGTWQGVIGKLDYIQSMGFDAIWISPIVENIEQTTAEGQAYHGYWTQDQNALNTHFGTDADLKLLSTMLHERNMYLMIDVVVNHMAATALPPTYSAFTPLDNSTDFHSFCWITDYSNQTNVEQCWLGDQNVPLADVDTEDPNIVDFFNAWIHGLVSEYGADGVRIDTVKHVRKDFWPNFTQAAGVWSVGEVLDGDVQYVSQYTQVLDAVLDYPTFYPLTAAFANTSGDLTALASTVQASQSAYRLGQFMTGSFLENQDNPRFQSFQKDQALVKNAMTWPFIQDGVPILYYGQEQGYTGADDPYNREALWLSGYEEDKPLVMHVRTLNAARKAAVASNNAFLSTALKFLITTKTALAVSKPPMLTLLSNGGNTSTPSWSVPNAGYSKGEQLIDVLSCNIIRADKNGGVSVQGAGGMPQVIMPTSAFNVSYCKSLKGDLNGNAGAATQGASSSSPAWGVKASVLPLFMTVVLVLISWSAAG